MQVLRQGYGLGKNRDACPGFFKTFTEVVFRGRIQAQIVGVLSQGRMF